ncbi:MAG: S8 family serine peptidase, partial [Gemmatimonadota bacterium]
IEAKQPVEQLLGTGRGVRVGVVDSGWDRSIFDPRVSKGVGLVDLENDLALCFSDDDNDRIGHGTACASLIMRSAPDAEIVPIRVFGRRLETSVPILVAGLNWAVERALQVVNLSLGTLRWQALRPLYAACERARHAGVIIVAARDTARMWSFPAVFDNVIGVEAGQVKRPYGLRYKMDAAIECVANGRHRVRWRGGGLRVLQGNSLAAPIISGAVARLLEVQPLANLATIRTLLNTNASTFGQRRL